MASSSGQRFVVVAVSQNRKGIHQSGEASLPTALLVACANYWVTPRPADLVILLNSVVNASDHFRLTTEIEVI